MPRTIVHHGITASHPVKKGSQGIRYTASGQFPVEFPGRLILQARAAYTVGIPKPKKPPAGDDPAPFVDEVLVPVSLVILAPDGSVWDRPDIGLADVQRYRDARGGGPVPVWSYRATSDWVQPEQPTYKAQPLQVHIAVEETVPIDSAPDPLTARLPPRKVSLFDIDLFQVGRLVISVLGSPASLRHGGMVLTNPDGALVARVAAGEMLVHEIGLPGLRPSRGADGSVRPWRLQVQWPHATAGRVWARVEATTALAADLVHRRLNQLFGPNGEKISLFVERANDGANLVRLRFNDAFTAETFGLHDLLRKMAPAELNSKEDLRNPRVGVAYVLARIVPSRLGLKRLDASGLKIQGLQVSIGASQLIQPPVPAIRLQIATQGELTGTAEVWSVGAGFSVAPRDNRLALEIGLLRNATGELATRVEFSRPLFDIDADSWLLKPLVELFEGAANDGLASALQRGFEALGSAAPGVARFLMGGEFEFTRVDFADNALRFAYRAPKEPDPRPSPGYIGVAGRSATQLGPGTWTMTPPLRPDTWAAGNLQKVDHIVVVMMENRAYDHVLGYRSMPPISDGSDGWTTPLVDHLAGLPAGVGGPHRVRPLAQSGILPNAVGLKTRLRSAVGHNLAAVQEQLAGTLAWNGRTLLDPKGFKANFAPLAAGNSVDGQKLVPDDVLGYYGASDLPFYGFLCQHHGFSDRYFSAHPGPTLPNRMYWLTGDVQFDRLGVPIIDNNHGENWRLSRSRSIFDVLSMHGVGWRVYESPPSVAMARFFARYAGDDRNILPVGRFLTDARAGQLPSVSFVEPAMHHAPANDDHPPNDMYDGQRFLREVYTALAANPDKWRKTLLIISYDEHGGFYDHALPPVAEVRTSGAGLPAGSPWQAVFARAGASDLVIRYGVRVPAFVVSPWVPAGKGPATVLDHTSILKTILARFTPQARPFLSDRVAAAASFNGFLSASTPRNLPNPPALPAPPATVLQRTGEGASAPANPVSMRQLQAGAVDFHDLDALLGRMLGRPAAAG